MKYYLIKLYSLIPSWLRDSIGKTPWLDFFRDFLLKKEGTYREVSVKISKFYENHHVKFEFYASIKDAAKASNKGIETTLLNNSFKLLNVNKTSNNNLTIFDIGANFGYLSLVWGASVSNDNGSVYAFEPNPVVYNTLTKSINKNKLDNIIKVDCKAIGSQNKIVDLYLDNTTSNTLKISESNYKVEVEMMTLDYYCTLNNINKCDLIKIDVDGVELSVLKGSIQMIINFRPIFIVETNNDYRIIEFLKKYNYKILDMKLEEYLKGDEIPLNIFCIPK